MVNIKNTVAAVNDKNANNNKPKTVNLMGKKDPPNFEKGKGIEDLSSDLGSHLACVLPVALKMLQHAGTLNLGDSEFSKLHLEAFYNEHKQQIQNCPEFYWQLCHMLHRIMELNPAARARVKLAVRSRA